MTANRATIKISALACTHTPTEWDQRYPYTADLLCLSFCHPPQEHHWQELYQVSTPLEVEAWEVALAAHPDRAYARYICWGLREGFRIGFQHGRPLESATVNMPSTGLRPEAISSYIEGEQAKGRMLGPFPPAWRQHLHVNRFGLIPKGHNTGKFRLITDLSFPRGRSVNDGISSELTSLSYISVDNVGEIVASMGAGALLAKMDIESAYRLVPVHPQDRILQAVEWEGHIFVDPMLPFGLCSAPKIFNSLADALNWCLQQAGIRYVLHYLDDFIIIAPPDSQECEEALAILDRVCDQLNIPMAAHKREGPTTCLIFLGILIDTVAGELRLPEEKLARLRALLHQWGEKRACTRRELESLIGLLNHACKVVRPGRAFLRRLLDTLHGAEARPGSNGFVRLNVSCRTDIAWWREFVTLWNGVSFLHPPHLLPSVMMTSDASGAWGCAAWHNLSWFQVQWDSRAEGFSIAAKEFIPIILACVAWGGAWRAHRVICRCDNQVVVAALRARSSRDRGVMHLLRCLAFVKEWLGCHLAAEYIDTHSNHLADDLSRDRASSFLSKLWEPTTTPLQHHRDSSMSS